MFQSTGSSLTIKSAASEEPPATANEASDDGRITTPYFGEIATYDDYNLNQDNNYENW